MLVPLTAGSAHAATCGPITQLNVPNSAALAFEGGPNTANGTNQALLDYFGAKRVRATFFETGLEVIAGPMQAAAVTQEFNAGHQVAFTDWDHRDLTTMSSPQIVSSLNSVSTAIQGLIGVSPTYEAPPYSRTNDQVTATICGLGLNQIIPTIDLSGPDITLANALSTLTADLKVLAGSGTSPIVMLPETSVLEAQLVTDLLLTKGYNLMTVAQGLGDTSPYR